MKLRSMK